MALVLAVAALAGCAEILGFNNIEVESSGGDGGSGSSGSSGGSGGGCHSPEDCPAVGECLERTCDQGVCSPAAKLLHTPCQTDGWFCDGGGQCVECVAAEDCPDQGDECKLPVCDNGLCGLENVAQGKPLAAQAQGDCQQAQCNGDGGVTSVPDNDDIPDDGNPCTVEACNAGVLDPSYAGSGAPCGNGGTLVCDGLGACVGCVSPAQCDIPGNECMEAACTAGVCGAAPKVSGTPCNDGSACTQTDTCQSGTCVGGNPIVCMALDQCHIVGTCDPVTGACSDPPSPDGTPCDVGDVCTTADVCQAGVCVAEPLCTGGSECDLGTCVAAGSCNVGVGLPSPPWPTVGTSPTAIAWGDLNTDGKPDLVVANSGSNNVSVLLAKGKGFFHSAVPYPMGTTPVSVVVADLNNDGKLDVATANQGSSNVSVRLGQGDGTLGTPSTFATQSSPRSIAAANMDIDGKMDLVVANYGSNSVSVLFNSGNGAFPTRSDYSVGSHPTSLKLANIDGAGGIDVVVTNEGSDSVSVLANNGGGMLGVSASVYDTGPSPGSVWVWDLDGDADLDIAVANAGGGSVSILVNQLTQGGAGFAGPFNFPAGTGVTSVTAAYLDGKYGVDLVVTNGADNNVSVLENQGNDVQGNPVFGAPLQHPVVGGPGHPQRSI
ncbi:MAG: VCBS repeat-containing protein [Polyangiaceae bacterium]